MKTQIKTMDCSVDDAFVFTTEVGQVRFIWEQGVTSIDRQPAGHVGIYMAEVNGKSVYEDMEPVNDFAWDKPAAIVSDPELLEKLNISMDEYLACRELAEDALQRFLEEAQEKA